MPLVWAHAEFIKLMVSRHLGPRSTCREQCGGGIKEIGQPLGMPSGGSVHLSGNFRRHMAGYRTAPRRHRALGQ
jgi:hypothetical protein